MSFNTFGRLFRVTTWGESHGPSIGCVIDGCPPRIPLAESDIQPFLDARRPGTSRFVTQRREPDRVTILSGVFEGLTTGTPISLLIENTDQRSKDYSEIKDRYRPGHADYTYDAKYGHRDYRGGGRSSARETAMRVAAGAVARKVLDGVSVRGAVVSIGDQDIDRSRWDWTTVGDNPFWCPDPVSAKAWEDYLDGVRKDGNSVGAILEVQAEGVPAGWGSPVYAKLDADIAAGLMSINAAKGVEIGDGFAAGRSKGTDNADEMRLDENGGIRFLANHSGGILGGISNGNTVTARLAIKPTSSMLTPTQSVNARGEEVDVVTKGRHDPCVGIRAVPVAEAMLACALADAMMMHRAQVGEQVGAQVG
jgi:chorismate synthase